MGLGEKMISRRRFGYCTEKMDSSVSHSSRGWLADFPVPPRDRTGSHFDDRAPSPKKQERLQKALPAHFFAFFKNIKT